MRLRKRGGWCRLLWWVGAVLPAAAQHHAFTHWAVADGLAQSQVMHMLQDRRGDLWLGTQGGGLDRFDGERFENFRQPDGLANNLVYRTFESRAGHLWVATQKGLSRFDGRHFRNYEVGNNVCYHAVEDPHGPHVWVTTSDGGIFRVDTTGTTQHHGQEEGFTDAVVSDLEVAPDGTLWISTLRDGLFTLHDGTFEQVPLPRNFLERAICLYFDLNDVLWVGTDRSVYRREADGTFCAVHDFGAYDIQQEDSTHYWFAAARGARRSDGTTVQTFGAREGLTDMPVKELMRARAGSIWFGMMGSGIARYAGSGFTSLDRTQGLTQDVVMAVTRDRRGNHWFGTSAQGLNRYDGDTITTYGTDEGLLDGAVVALAADSAGGVWVGTRAGLATYDARRDRFRPVGTDEGLYGYLPRSIVCDARGRLWVATTEGLFRR
ncbi:MAG: two-component regulator propeller domain-containing protein, partial [Catalinimonas sp.]